MDVFKLFIHDTTWPFILEIMVRSCVMYILILLFLRISGKRGIRQLSIFELAIILCLGSAAGDPMFTEDLPIVQAFLVIFTILLLYRFTTWSMMKNQKIEELLEGKPLYIVEEGELVIDDVAKEKFSHDEFFAEMRQCNIEHLGQVRAALLETDGSLSVLFYTAETAKWGLPIFPKAYVKVEQFHPYTFYACMFCGCTQIYEQIQGQRCPRCNHTSWAQAIRDAHWSL